ncbi:MAG: transcription antitermination factor NusB, partial [Candidatus Aminicenantes bacterium]|nr:transcription antitermination factor NusB [Candidatus Aminicenantes bacterium]
CALQILYELEFDSNKVDEKIRQFWREKKASEEIREYSRWLVKGVFSRLQEIDEAIQSTSEHWRISRMTLVDRNILRLAAFELLAADTLAPAIVINEAIEIAKKYSGPEAAVFVNGILDALRKKIRADKVSAGEVPDVRKRQKKN